MTLFLCVASFFAGAFFGVILLAVLVAGKSADEKWRQISNDNR